MYSNDVKEYLGKMDKDQVLTVDECATYLKLHRRTVLILLNQGKIPGHKFGDQWRILKSEVDSYMKRREDIGGKAKKK